jgi:prepilin-type processing-associated H-X9-DG protein
MWTEAIKHFAENGKGNVIFLDGSSEGMKRSLEEMMAVMTMNLGKNKE